MDRFGYSATSLDELKQIQNEVSSTQSLHQLREYFERVQELKRIHSGNFDVQLLVAETQEAIIEQARDLRSRGFHQEEDVIFEQPMASGSGTALASERAEPYRAEAAPRGDRNWRRATVLALILTAAICGVFFFLIQAARKINMPEETPAPPAAKNAPQANTNAPKQAAAAPAPSRPTLRLYTDLIPGTVTIDGGAAQDLTDGELVLDKLTPGEHSIQVIGRSGSATFRFRVAEGKAPEPIAPVTGTNALAVLVSAQDGKGQLLASTTGADVSLDGKSIGQTGPDALALTELGTADHELQIGQQNDHQRFIMTYTAAPVLTAYVKSVVSLGTVTIKTKQDGVSVFVQGKLYRRKTDHGQVRIPLKVGTYAIRVHKEGYIDPAPQNVDIKKGEEAELVFELAPVPQFAALEVNGAPEGAVVSMDGTPVATIGADGHAKANSIKPGDHVVEVRLDGYTPKRFVRTFQAGSTVTLTSAETTLQKPVVEAKPQQATPQEQIKKPAASVQAVDIPGEQVHRGGDFVAYNTPRAAGHYSFEAHSKIGGFLKRDKLQWYAGYQDSDNYVMFTVDGKHASARRVVDGKAEDISRVPFSANSEAWIQVEMSVSAGSISARIRKPGGDWSSLGAVTSGGRDFTKGRVGFYLPGNDEIAVANFHFSPK